MTRDEIMAMDAAQLRLAIAAARGDPWRRPTHGSCCTCQTCGQSHDDCKCGITGDIGDAWELVEEANFVVGPEYSGGFDSVRVGWAVYHNWMDAADDTWSCMSSVKALSIAETAPLAIARAWLMWKEGV